MKTSPTCAILIVNYKTAWAVSELLESIAGDPARGAFFISVWDNSCDPAELEALLLVIREFEGVFGALTCSASNINLGYAAGNNAAWLALQEKVPDTLPEVVIVVNPDVRVQSGSIGNLAEEVRANSYCLFSVPTVTTRGLLSGQAALHRWTGQSRQLEHGAHPSRWEFVYPGGHFLAISSILWRSSKGFSEDFFLYCEEADITLRLNDGTPPASTAVSSAIRVAHSEGLSTASKSRPDAKSLITYQHATRSRIILLRKHKSLRASLLTVTVLRILWALRTLAQGKSREAGSILTGLCSGYQWRPEKKR